MKPRNHRKKNLIDHLLLSMVRIVSYDDEVVMNI